MHSMVFPRPVPGCSSSRSDVLVTLVEPWLISRSSFCCDASWRGSGGLSGPHSALEAFIGILICRRDTQQGVVSTRAHARVPLWLRVRVASAPNAYVRPLDVRMSLGRTSHGRASHDCVAHCHTDGTVTVCVQCVHSGDRDAVGSRLYRLVWSFQCGCVFY